MTRLENVFPDPWLNTKVGMAWRESYLGSLPVPIRDRLLVSARERRLPARTLLRAEATDTVYGAFLMLMVEGHARSFQSSESGRELTFRRVGSGDVVGLASVVAGHAPSAVETVTDAYLVEIDGGLYRSLARTSAELAWVTSRELSRLLYAIQDRLAFSVFETVWHRVARHLLEVAEVEGGRFVVRASNQATADAIGTVREVVGRALNEMQLDGLIERQPHRIILLDPDRLDGAAHTARWTNMDVPVATRAFDGRFVSTRSA